MPQRLARILSVWRDPDVNKRHIAGDRARRNTVVRTSNPTLLTVHYRTPSPTAAGRGKDEEIVKPAEGESQQTAERERSCCQRGCCKY
jgi:hypothetical protein